MADFLAEFIDRVNQQLNVFGQLANRFRELLDSVIIFDCHQRPVFSALGPEQTGRRTGLLLRPTLHRVCDSANCSAESLCRPANRQVRALFNECIAPITLHAAIELSELICGKTGERGTILRRLEVKRLYKPTNE